MILIDGVTEASLTAQDISEVVMGFKIIRCELECLSMTSFSLGQLQQPVVDGTQRIPDHRITGKPPGRLDGDGECFFKMLKPKQR